MSFRKLWENMNSDKGNKQPQEVDESALTAIRSGIGVNETFWSDFIQVLNNSEGLSVLLDVPIDEISTWRKKIENAIDAIEARDGELSVKKNKKIMKTSLPDDEDFDGA
jgi:PHP family Zn ribbon phosphoesterase